MLERLFTPDTALTIRGYYETWGKAFLLAIPLLVIGVVILQFASKKYEHVAYVQGQVKYSTIDTTKKHGFRASFVIRTPDGQDHLFITRDVELFNSAVKTVCLDERRFEKSEKLVYLIVPLERCIE